MVNKKIDSELIKKVLGASEVIPLDGQDGMSLYLERRAMDVDKDTRNVSDKYKGWMEDLIKEDLNKNTLPYAVCMAQIVGDFNFGAVVRSANAFGAQEVFYYGKKSWDKRSAVGTNHYSNIKYLSTIDELKSLKEKYIFVALENNIDKKTIDIRNFNWPTNSLIMIGEEGLGLSTEVLDLCDHFVEIPMVGTVRSFNAAAAATISMYDYVFKYSLNNTT